MPRIPFFARLPKATVREIKRRARKHGVSEAAVIEDAVAPPPAFRGRHKNGATTISWEKLGLRMTKVGKIVKSGGPRRKARGGRG